MATLKSEFRERFLTRREGLSPSQRRRASEQIMREILAQPIWKKSEVVLTYVSMGSEVDTRPLIEEALRSKKRVAVPLIHPDGRDTQIAEIKDLRRLIPGPKYGILEPPMDNRQLVDPAGIDLGILPGVAFDRFGGRLGFGSGYFDRLLPQLTKAVLWGVAFKVQLSDQPLPMESHDHPVHAVVTEDEFIYPEEVG